MIANVKKTKIELLAEARPIPAVVTLEAYARLSRFSKALENESGQDATKAPRSHALCLLNRVVKESPLPSRERGRSEYPIKISKSIRRDFLTQN